MKKSRERIDGPTIMERLAFQRYMRGESITDVAKTIGVTRRTLSGYELCNRNVPFYVVEELCKALNFRLIVLDEKGKKVYENCN